MYLKLSAVLAMSAMLSLASGRTLPDSGDSAPNGSSSLSTFVTEVAAADSTPPVADPVLGLAASASDTKFCTNRKEGIQAGDCSKTKGFGYASAHNCGGGNHYSCKRGGNVECLTLKAAKKQGLEGGYCYTE